ncbi:hypothetical protein B0F90DRAFT_1784916 [Multifurca ochricompacta]|uniref:Uncharacterized protein n=1 Tax=Multifurca ochricompacta TaxID=376703 RepID=A0AAD4LUE6_9AGAM|nr:hypothetical protein B0F90DRAFT_1784916 [Multifurca ochricompacta]
MDGYRCAFFFINLFALLLVPIPSTLLHISIFLFFAYSTGSPDIRSNPRILHPSMTSSRHAFRKLHPCQRTDYARV